MDLPVGTRVLIRAVVIGEPTVAPAGVDHVSCRGQLSGHTMNDIVLSDIVIIDTPIVDTTPAPPVVPQMAPSVLEQIVEAQTRAACKNNWNLALLTVLDKLQTMYRTCEPMQMADIHAAISALRVS